MDELLLIVQTINSYLSNYVLIVLLIGAGLFSLFAPVLCRFAALAKASSDCLVDST